MSRSDRSAKFDDRSGLRISPDPKRGPFITSASSGSPSPTLAALFALPRLSRNNYSSTRARGDRCRPRGFTLGGDAPGSGGVATSAGVSMETDKGYGSNRGTTQNEKSLS